MKVWEESQRPDRRSEAAPTLSLFRHWRRFVATLQDCVMQIGRMRFARVECYDYAFVLEIDFYVLHAGNVLQHRSQFAHTLIAIFAFRRDFDRFQNRMIGALRGKRIGRIGISRSCRVHRFSYLTFEKRAVVAFGWVILSGVEGSR